MHTYTKVAKTAASARGVRQLRDGGGKEDTF